MRGPRIDWLETAGFARMKLFGTGMKPLQPVGFPEHGENSPPHSYPRLFPVRTSPVSDPYDPEFSQLAILAPPAGWVWRHQTGAGIDPVRRGLFVAVFLDWGRPPAVAIERYQCPRRS